MAPPGRRPREPVHAGERGDERRRRRLQQLCRRRGLDDRAALHHGNAVGEPDDVGDVVRDQDGGKAQGAEMLPQLRGHLPLRRGVERREGFVQQQGLRAGGDGAGQRDPLPLPAGERPGPFVRQVQDAEALQRPRDPRVVRGPPPAAQPEGHVARHRQVREQRVVLEHQAHRSPLGGKVHARGVEQDPAVQFDPAARRAGETGHGAEDRGLPGSRRADQRQDAGGHVERRPDLQAGQRDANVDGERHVAGATANGASNGSPPRSASFTPTRRPALTATSIPAMARATGKSWRFA